MSFAEASRLEREPGRWRILVVDDEPDMLENVARILRRSSHQCITAASGQEALALVERERPDLILTDPPYGIGPARSGDAEVAYAVLALWGLVDTESEKAALETMARTVPGARGVESHLVVKSAVPYVYWI